MEMQPLEDAWNCLPYVTALDKIDPLRRCGQVTDMVGLLIEANGPATGVGDFCEIETPVRKKWRRQVKTIQEAIAIHS